MSGRMADCDSSLDLVYMFEPRNRGHFFNHVLQIHYHRSLTVQIDLWFCKS